MTESLEHAPSRLRPVLVAVGLTLVWLLVLHVSASSLPLYAEPWMNDLRAAGVNVIAAGVPLVVIVHRRWWRRAAVALHRPDRSWWVLVPLLVMALGYATGGLTGSISGLASSAVLFLALGVNEEMMFRGVVQGVLRPFPLGLRCALVGVIFGVQHIANLLFGLSLYEAGAQVLSATANGFAYAAARARIDTIWPLALLHGLGNFLNTHAAVPFTSGLHLAYLGLEVVYGILVIRTFRREMP